MSKKVLIVDDDPDVRLFNATVVEESGFTPIEAANGEEGLKSLLPVVAAIESDRLGRRVFIDELI